MRDGSARQRVTNPQPRTWTPERVEARHWRERHRLAVLHEMAEGAHDLRWTRRLVNVLLDELHVTDEFDRLVGPVSRAPVSQFPRLIAIALLLRHSWSLYDLSRAGQRIGLECGPLEAQLNITGCDCAQRRRRASRASLSGPRPH
jgi:hypothetical protein